MSGSTVPLERVLHLKSGVAYLENNTMLVAGEFRACREFGQYRQIPVDDDEMYAANALWLNGAVLWLPGIPRRSELSRKRASKLWFWTYPSFANLTAD